MSDRNVVQQTVMAAKQESFFHPKKQWQYNLRPRKTIETPVGLNVQQAKQKRILNWLMNMEMERSFPKGGKGAAGVFVSPLQSEEIIVGRGTSRGFKFRMGKD